jgi:excisionase family DNA binding protein
MNADRSNGRINDNESSTEQSLAVRKILLAPEDAAAALSISERTLWQLTRDGEIRAVGIGARTLYRPRDLQRYAAQLPERQPRKRGKQEPVESSDGGSP